MRSPCPSLSPAMLQTQTAPTGSRAAVSLAGVSQAVPCYAVPRHAYNTMPVPYFGASPVPFPPHIPRTAPWLHGTPEPTETQD